MKKNIVWGLILILLAVYLIASHLGLAPMLSVAKIAGTVIFLYVIYKGIREKSFVMGLFGLSIIYILYSDAIESVLPVMDHVSGWLVVFVAILIGAGLDLIFKGVFHKKTKIIVNGQEFVRNEDGSIEGKFVEDDGMGHQSTVFTGGNTSNLTGNDFHFENTFGETSKYITSDCFEHGHFENAFGAMNIYMDNVVLNPNGAKLHIEASFGEINVYLPANCKINLSEDSAFGKVKLHGQATAAENAPILDIKAESAFGDINIYFK